MLLSDYNINNYYNRRREREREREGGEGGRRERKKNIIKK